MRWHADLTMGQRLALSFVVACGLLGLLIGVSHQRTAEITDLRQMQTNVIAPRAAAADHLEDAILYLGIATRTYLLAPTPARMRSYEAARQEVDEALVALADKPKEGDGARTYALIPPLVDRYQEASDDMVRTASRQGDLHERDPALVALREELLERLRQYTALQRGRVEAARAQTNHAVLDLDRAILYFGGLLILLLAVTGWLATRSVRAPAKALVDATRRIGAGDFEPAHALLKESEGRERLRDELAELSRAFGRMGVDLEAREKRLQAQQEELQAQHEELQAQHEELQAQQEELQSQNEELQAQREELQAQGDELARTVERLTAGEEALREADRNKDEFLAVLSHELRNPLTPIRNSLFVLQEAPAGSEEAKRALVIVDRQVEQLSQLVDDLLDVTRISRGKIQLRRTGVDLGRLVRGVAEDNRSLFEDTGIELSVQIPGETVKVEGDPTRLAQVVGNLLQNAAKFTPRGGRVALALEAAGGKARIEVRDSGTGMAPETLARLFQPFMQADIDLARTKGGLGLGLALVKGLMEMHGGTVCATSEGRGRGSVFTLELPTSDVALQAEPHATPRASGCRVLVIEDNVDAADSLREALQIIGHAVEVAHQGSEGISMARAQQPDIVLCDVGLPDMDGHQVAKTFRSDPRLQSVFMVALTGYARPEDRVRAKEAGFDQHVAKPVSMSQLEALLAEASHGDRGRASAAGH